MRERLASSRRLPRKPREMKAIASVPPWPRRLADGAYPADEQGAEDEPDHRAGEDQPEAQEVPGRQPEDDMPGLVEGVQDRREDRRRERGRQRERDVPQP